MCQKVFYTLYMVSKSVLYIQLVAIFNPGVSASPRPTRNEITESEDLAATSVRREAHRHRALQTSGPKQGTDPRVQRQSPTFESHAKESKNTREGHRDPLGKKGDFATLLT